jgi:leader peptidase (prepilin peptidase) / N-methyltransferase
VVLHDDPAELALGLVFVALLGAITLTDLERRVIPNAILLAGAAIGLGIVAITDPASLPERAAAAAGAGGFLLLFALVYPRGMGMGDVKLAAVMGLFLGASVVPALFVGIVLGAFVGFGLMLRRGAGARKHAVPFGPFLALGGVVGLLAGSQMIDAYLTAFVR